MVWIAFTLCAAVILFAGVRLSYYGDAIAEKTGLGRTWIGVVLLASVTSLPELMAGISSVALANVPDIAVGDALGSCMFNLLLLAFLDLAGGSSPLSARAHQGQVLTASAGILLLGVFTIALHLGPRMPGVGWVGWHTVVLLVLYMGVMRLVFAYERRRVAEFVEKVGDENYSSLTRTHAYSMYALYAALTLAAATYLPYAGEEIARSTGLGQSFVGNILIAASTSLPEIVVSWAALKMGAVDMAFGNLFGSNLFDMAILGIDDLFYTPGVLTAHVAPSHAIPAIAAMMMTAVAILGLTYRSTRKTLLLAWDSWGIVSIYSLAVAALYFSR
jgi:cation:H+ antiporter